MVKKRLKQLIGPKLLGALDYFRFPETRQSWGGPLNGQARRQEMISELIEYLGINAVVETGTYRGTTTEYFAELCPGPVFTVETDARLYGYAKTRLFFKKNVTVVRGDSREFLRYLATDKRLAGKRILFYLDAHWGDELPLVEELDLVFENWKDSVVVIDDFQVPDDPGYGYDDYGTSGALKLSYVAPVLQKHNVNAFFPTRSSSEDTGAKRGCVLLVADLGLGLDIATLSTLRSYGAR